MANNECLRIMRDDFASLGFLSSTSASSSQTAFPITNAFNRQRRSKVWRSNGFYKITSSNNTLVFQETTAVDLTATVVVSEYTSASALGTAIKTAMEAVGASVYTITFSSTTNKFTIASDRAGGGGIFNLQFQDAPNTIEDVIGFPAVEFTDAASHEGDFVRIHTEEFILWDMGIATDPTSFILIGPRNKPLRFTPTSVLKLEASPTNNFDSPPFSTTLTLDDNVINTLSLTGLAGVSYRFWRLSIVDKDNPDGFVEVGALFLGNHYIPAAGSAQFPLNQVEVDRSTAVISEGGQIIVDKREKTQETSINWRFLSKEDKEDFEFIFEQRFGISTPFFVVLDADNNFTVLNKDQIKFFRFVSAPSYNLERANKYTTQWRLREGI